MLKSTIFVAYPVHGPLVNCPARNSRRLIEQKLTVVSFLTVKISTDYQRVALLWKISCLSTCLQAQPRFVLMRQVVSLYKCTTK